MRTSLAALSVVLLLGITPAVAQTQVPVVRTSSKSFENTVAALESAIQAKGFMIVGRVDHQNMLRMVGARAGGSRLLEFGKPDMMKQLLPQNPEIGLTMPLRVYVYEGPNGGVLVSYYKPSDLFGAFQKKALEGPGMMMDQAVAEIIAAALK